MIYNIYYKKLIISLQYNYHGHILVVSQTRDIPSNTSTTSKRLHRSFKFSSKTNLQTKENNNGIH